MFHRRKPLVSVVLASYNHERFVRAAVESVLGQGVDELELIVVDDGSPDATPDIVASIDDPRIRLVRLEENRRHNPRNIALELASGEYVAFQNSDDSWKPGKLSAQLEFMRRNPECSACFTGVEVIGENGGPVEGTFANGLFTNENRGSAAWLRRFFDVGNCLCLTSAVARRKQVERAGRFRPSLFLLADLDLWVRLAAVGRFHIIEEPLTCFRVVTDENLSTPVPRTVRRGMLEYADVLSRYVEEPAMRLLPEAFHDVIPSGVRTVGAVLAALAKHAWALGPAQRLFADRLMAGVLADPVRREEALEAFGARVVLDFIENRSELDVRTMESQA